MSEAKKLLEEKELTVEFFFKKMKEGKKINCPKPYKDPKKKERKLF